MIPNKKIIAKELTRLRMFIDRNNDNDLETFIRKRLAYFAEMLLRWTQEDTENWKLPLEEALEEAELILRDIETKST